MIITNKVTVHLDRRGEMPELNAVQGDSARAVDISLLFEKEPWVIPEGTTAMIRYKNLRIGTGGVYDTMPDGASAYSFSENKVTLYLPEQVFGVDGRVELQVTLLQDGVEISVFSIKVRVQRNLTSDAMTEEDYENLTEHIRTEVDAAVQGLEMTAGVWVTVAQGDDLAYSADRTHAELTAAYENGQELKCRMVSGWGSSETEDTELILLLVSVSGDGVKFQCTVGQHRHLVLITADDSVSYNYAVVANSSDVSEGGVDGKSAYEYAQDGGYTGTEEEFAAKLAVEPCFVTITFDTGDNWISDKTANEIYKAYRSGIAIYGLAIHEDATVPLTCQTAVTYDAEGVCVALLVGHETDDYTKMVSFMIATTSDNATYCSIGELQNLATESDIPTTLPNPHKLIFTGAVSGEYDGSGEVTIDIPTAGAEVETETVLSDNLFDQSTATQGSIFYHSSSGTTLTSLSTGFYAYVPLAGVGTYRTIICWIQHGEDYAKRVPILKEDNSFLQNVTGTLTDIDGTYGYLEFTITDDMVTSGAAVYAYDGAVERLDSLMIVKDREYPSEYIPYGYIEVAVESAEPVNILSGKTAVFFGDSICAGTTTLADAPEYGYGWAGLIGEANKMTWGNYGRNGGTITPVDSVEEARWVPTQVDAALAAHPTADYVIFEGGTNDADTLGADGLGTFSASGYAPAGDADFTGAFETLVLKILNAYPNARVGYIVAPKMGAVSDYSSANNNRRQFFDRAVEICEKWGIPVLDLWKSNPLNPNLSVYYDSSLTAYEANTNGKCYTDGQHLTLTGYQRITPQIEAFMRGL